VGLDVYEVYKGEVDTQDELLAHMLLPA